MEKVNESPEAPPTLHLAEEEEEEVESEEEEQQEEELPILKAQEQPRAFFPKRRPGGNRFLDATKKKNRQDDSEGASVANRGGSPDIVALPPPQLHSVLDNDVSSSSVSSDDNEEPVEDDGEEATDKEDDDDSSISPDVAQVVSLESFLAGRLSEIAANSSIGCRQVVKLPQGRAVFYTDKDGKAIVPPNRQTAPPKKSLEPRRIIQSLFAKPKPLKSKKRKGLSKKAKMALAKSKRTAPSKSADGRGRSHEANEDSQNDEQDDEETGYKKTHNSEDEGSSEEESQKKARKEESEEEKERTQTHMLRKRRRLYEGNTDGWKKRREEEEEAKSEDEEESDQQRAGGNKDTAAVDRSEDEDDEGIEYEGQGGWKPMRAAMVAAMELVAKKQVTDDMRNERRIRKHLKPMPPKGKGRRSIFKKLSKPAKSLINDNIPRVKDKLTYEDTLFLKGDILCLKQDLFRGEEVRFYQARGFLRGSQVGESVSVLPLVRIVEQSDEVDVITAVKNFNPRDFKLRFDFPPALLNFETVELVQRCPHDFYHGHDALFQDPQPGYTYCRVKSGFPSR